MTTALPLGLRNRLAELILDAFDDRGARRTLEALAAFCRSMQGQVGAEAAARLTALGWFEAAGPDRVGLLGAHRAHVDALCRRTAAAVAMLGSRPAPPGGESLAGLLARAALLADAGLYFEVHELLEPAWMRAEGAERVALQGLIQIAVAFHHASSGNREGAISLMSEGLAKLGAAGSVLPLDTAAWTRALAGRLAAWREESPPPPGPDWPRPQTAWRSS
ncbi:MAG: DUF309 domain-containing protein [Candidatus Rokubacteria bacterium]|nr:DUF309 domain-containing protein [Candidatus Rokubacteria bacterium]